MGKRTWTSHTAEGNLKPMAAWQWMRFYFDQLDAVARGDEGAVLPRIDGALRSVLAPPLCLIGFRDEARAPRHRGPESHRDLKSPR